MHVHFIAKSRPGDSPEVDYTTQFDRTVEVDIEDTRLGNDDQQVGLAECAGALSEQFLDACKPVLMDRLASLAVAHQVLADIYQGLQEWGVLRAAGDDDEVTTVYNKSYTDEDAVVYKFIVRVESGEIPA